MNRLKIYTLSTIVATSSLFVACDVLDDVSNVVLTDTAGSNKLTNEEVIAGLKEALTVGTKNSSENASKEDGFNKNPKIRLPFPEDAQHVKEKVESVGFTEQVEKFELTLNRAAEEAAKEAAPIFIDAVKGMSIADGWNILKGPDNAATEYLKEKTTAQLKVAFRPKVEKAIETVQLTKYWEPIMNKYNTVTKFTGGEPVNTDLNEYVTDKAIEGLFTLIAEEEKDIRENPAARVTDLLDRVFGYEGE